MDEDTRSGIDFMRYGLYISVGMNALFGIFFLAWSYDPRGDPSELACFLVIIGLAAGILFLAAIYKLYQGKENISFQHERNVKTAVFLIIIGFFFGLASPSLDGGSLSALRSSMVLGSSVELIQQIAYAAAIVLLVFEIAREKARKYLYVGASLLIIGSFSRLAWGILFIPQQGELLDVLMATLRVLSVLMLLLALGYFFLARGYTKAARSPRQRRKTESPAIFSKKKCPNCGSEEFTGYMDGSGYCENCGKTFRSGDESKKEKDQKKFDQEFK